MIFEVFPHKGAEPNRGIVRLQLYQNNCNEIWLREMEANGVCVSDILHITDRGIRFFQCYNGNLPKDEAGKVKIIT